MTPDPADEPDGDPMDRWAVPLREDDAAEATPVTEADFPLRIERMPEEGFHPHLRFVRDAG